MNETAKIIGISEKYNTSFVKCQIMNQQQATEVLKGILAKGEKAFSDTFGVPVGVYHESRNVFLLGYLQAAFVEVLVESHKTVLS